MTGDLLYDAVIGALALFGLALLLAGEYVEMQDRRKGRRK